MFRGYNLVIACVVALALLGGYYILSADKQMSLEDAVGQMLMVGFYGETLERNSETWDMLEQIRPGGVMLFARNEQDKTNITSPEQVKALTKSIQKKSKHPVFIAVDAEGGYVNRLKQEYGFSVVVPSAEQLGKQTPQQTKSIATQLADELKSVGINWNFAPVVDVNINPQSPAIGDLERSFSDDPNTVTEHARAFIEGLKTQRIIPTLKHFPGHGSSNQDTHLGITDVSHTYQQEQEIAPYANLISQGYNDPIMTAHIVNANLDSTGTPATLSAPIITGILRNQLNFQGVIISDDMQMGAIVQAYNLERAAVQSVQAGVDMIMITNNPGNITLPDGTRQYIHTLQNTYKIKQALIEAVENGTISEQRIYESVDRIVELKKRYGLD